MENNIFDTIIIGGGPAGLTAGIYLARGKAKVLILDTGTIGGQLVLTHKIANYPGVDEISGYQLSSSMKSQAKTFGCTIKSNIKITDLDFEGKIKTVTVNDKIMYSAKSMILATGGRSRMLGAPGEVEFKGQGVSYCATCDGDFFQDKEIVVVGGGNSALEEAVSLTKYATKVTILHQFDHFQAFNHAIEEAKANPKIEFIMESKITEFIGNEKLEKVKYENLKSGVINEKEVDGTFIFIGYEANTDMFQNTNLKLNKWKEVIANATMNTNIDGVFVAGDLREKKIRQVTTAVGDGTIAAISAMDYVHNN